VYFCVGSKIELLKLALRIMGKEGAPQESVAENRDEVLINEYQKSIDFHTSNINDFLKQKKENLDRRLKGEISGVELDRLDKQHDDAIEYSRKEMASFDSNIKFVRDNLHLAIKDFKDTNNHVNETQIEDKSSVSGEVEELVDAPVYPTTGSSTFDKQRQERADFTETQKYEVAIKEAYDMRSLITALKQNGDITAADGYVYDINEVVGIITSLENSNDPNLGKVTRTMGLRDRVKLILVKSELSKM